MVSTFALVRAIPEYSVAEHTDAVNLKFHNIACLEEAAVLEAATRADGSRAQYFAGMEGLRLGQVGDDPIESCSAWRRRCRGSILPR